MPCNSDYLEPTRRERELQRTARLLVYVNDNLHRVNRLPLLHAATDIYCRADYVPQLCAAISQMDEQERERIVYNAHDATSRDLADWWEEHQRADGRNTKEN